MSEHNADCDVYDMTEDLVLTGKPCNCNRRAVLLRVAGELLRCTCPNEDCGTLTCSTLRNFAAKYEREAAEVK